jgi:hypothetical protein
LVDVLGEGPVAEEPGCVQLDRSAVLGVDGAKLRLITRIGHARKHGRGRPHGSPANLSTGIGNCSGGDRKRLMSAREGAGNAAAQVAP